MTIEFDVINICRSNINRLKDVILTNRKFIIIMNNDEFFKCAYFNTNGLQPDHLLILN
jgi:hypothetical protein